MTAAAERETSSAIVARLDELGAETLWVVYHDFAGLGRAKAVPRRRFAEVAATGVTFAMANWDLAITDHQVPEPLFGADSGDFRAVPDERTLAILPHRPAVAQAFALLSDDLGEPWPGDPRRLLEGQVDRLAQLGVVARVAFETEFVLISAGDEQSLPWGGGRMFSVDALDARWAFGSTLLAGLEAAGVAAHQFAKEYGPAQFELSLMPVDPLAAADQFLVARQLAKALARESGLLASFMPKPYAELPGNGLHVHVGLARSDDPDREVVGDGPGDRSLTDTGRAAIAGLLAHAAGQAALAAPTPNSYKRLLPGSWAPAHVSWAFGNRAALVRIPGRGIGRHLEYRSGDASMNPYLHLTGLLAAIADGLERDLPAPAEADLDVGHLGDADAASRGWPRLPATLEQALAALEADDVLLEALGEVVVPHYLAVKRFEWRSYLDEAGLDAGAIEVSDWERATYLEPL